MSPTPPQTKTELVSDFRRSQILAAARQNFVKSGVAGTTVDAVAKEAGVAKGTVYLYFESKDELLKAILAQDLQEYYDSTVPAIRREGSLEARMEQFFRGALEFFEHKRDFFEQCHQEMTPALRKKAKAQFGVVFSAQTDAWREVLLAPPVTTTAADAQGFARTIVSLSYGLGLQRLKGFDTSSIDDTVAWACRLALKGVMRA